MSGHSKWANIKHKKGKADAARGKITTKIGREITIAVQMGGPDPVGNMRLKLALAKANNIPKDNIKRAIAKGAGETNGAKYEEITYEGYGPAGVAIMLDVLTDNRNRAAADIRHAFTKHGGNMGETGSVGWMFKRKGIFTIDKEAGYDEDEVMMIALDAGAEDVKVEEEVYEILTAPNDFSTVRENLEKQGFTFLSAEVQKIPQNTVAVTDPDTILKIQKMLDLLEENDDVQNVFHNADLPDEDEEDEDEDIDSDFFEGIKKELLQDSSFFFFLFHYYTQLSKLFENT